MFQVGVNASCIEAGDICVNIRTDGKTSVLSIDVLKGTVRWTTSWLDH